MVKTRCPPDGRTGTLLLRGEGGRMGIKFPEKTYFTFQELLVRWQCVPADLHRLIVSAKLTPSMRADIDELSGVDWEDDPFDGMKASERIEGYRGVGKRGYMSSREYQLNGHCQRTISTEPSLTRSPQ